MKYLIILLGAFSILFSCSSASDETSEPPEKIHLDEDSLTVKEVTLEGISGHFTVGDEAMAFINCENMDGLYWVIDESGELNKKIGEITSPISYKTYVVKIEGIEKNKVEEELQEGFSKTLTVKNVLSIEPRTHLNACLATETWGQGENNEWTLYISKEENVMEFYTRDKDISYQFFYSEPVKTTKGYSYADEALGSKIKVILETNGCEDGYGAIVTLNDETYVGCAQMAEKLSF